MYSNLLHGWPAYTKPKKIILARIFKTSDQKSWCRSQTDDLHFEVKMN